MDLNPFQNASLFLINTLFDLYMFIIMIRFILCWVRADTFNIFTRCIIKLTQPIIKPLRVIIPSYANIEFADIVLIIILSTLKFLCASLIVIGMPPHAFGLILLGCADTLKLFLKVFFYAILIQAILSWAQQGYSPASQFFSQLTSPIMRPLRRVIPPIGGFDFSPIPALILLHLSVLLIADPFIQVGMKLTFG